MAGTGLWVDVVGSTPTYLLILRSPSDIYQARGVKKINLRYHVPKHFTQKSSAKSCLSTIRSKIGCEYSGYYVTMTQTSVPACQHDRPWSINDNPVDVVVLVLSNIVESAPSSINLLCNHRDKGTGSRCQSKNLTNRGWTIFMNLISKSTRHVICERLFT